MPQLSSLVKELMRLPSVLAHVLRKLATQFSDLRKMVFILGVSLLPVHFGVEQVVPSDQFEDHGRQGPDIDGRSVVLPQDRFGCAILTSGDILCKVLVNPAGVAEVANLHQRKVKVV